MNVRAVATIMVILPTDKFKLSAATYGTKNASVFKGKLLLS